MAKYGLSVLCDTELHEKDVLLFYLFIFTRPAKLIHILAIAMASVHPSVHYNWYPTEPKETRCKIYRPSGTPCLKLLATYDVSQYSQGLPPAIALKTGRPTSLRKRNFRSMASSCTVGLGASSCLNCAHLFWFYLLLIKCTNVHIDTCLHHSSDVLRLHNFFQYI